MGKSHPCSLECGKGLKSEEGFVRSLEQGMVVKTVRAIQLICNIVIFIRAPVSHMRSICAV